MASGDERAKILREGLGTVRGELERLDEVLAEPGNKGLEPDLIGLALASIDEAIQKTRTGYRVAAKAPRGPRPVPGPDAPRADKLDHFVRREALTIFLQNLVSVFPEDTDEEDRELLEVEDDVANAPVDGIWDDLWPDWRNSNSPSPERAYADIRAELRVARMFSALAANPERSRETSDYFTYLAESHAAGLQGQLRLRPTVKA